MGKAKAGNALMKWLEKNKNSLGKKASEAASEAVEMGKKGAGYAKDVATKYPKATAGTAAAATAGAGLAAMSGDDDEAPKAKKKKRYSSGCD